MKFAKSLLWAFLPVLALSMVTFSCNNDDDDDGGTTPPPAGDDEVIVTDNITGGETWTADNVYVLAGRITVEDGGTLTIEPGTIIKGQAGTGANATALLVARGGTLNAVGTAALPIIFTSIADEITPEDVAAGNYGSPNLDPDINGLWGGVLVLGFAPISASNDNGDDLTEVQIEGIPTSDRNGLYGGNDPADNSGQIQYISIRHGGSNIGAGNEINGLTLGGVGTGTSISHVEVVANQDDGIEWFGGTVNVSHAVVWNAGDDGMDTDQAWSGTLDNFAVVTTGDNSFELDGPEGTLLGTHTLRNGGVIASDEPNEIISDLIAQLDDNSRVNLENIFVTGIVPADNQIDRTAGDPAEDGIITWNNFFLDVADAAAVVELLQDVDAEGDIPSGISAGTTNTFDASELENWTWADEVGGLNPLK